MVGVDTKPFLFQQGDLLLSCPQNPGKACQFVEEQGHQGGYRRPGKGPRTGRWRRHQEGYQYFQEESQQSLQEGWASEALGEVVQKGF